MGTIVFRSQPNGADTEVRAPASLAVFRVRALWFGRFSPSPALRAPSPPKGGRGTRRGPARCAAGCCGGSVRRRMPRCAGWGAVSHLAETNQIGLCHDSHLDDCAFAVFPCGPYDVRQNIRASAKKTAGLPLCLLIQSLLFDSLSRRPRHMFVLASTTSPSTALSACWIWSSWV